MATWNPKKLRAEVIRDALEEAGLPLRVVCFTCGNASDELRKAGLDVLAVGPGQELETSEWLTPERIRALWPDRFDATSGHLSPAMMVRLGKRFRSILGDHPPLCVAAGSGETALAIALAYPGRSFVAVYGGDVPGMAWDARNPLNVYVASRLGCRFLPPGATLPGDVLAPGRDFTGG